MSVTIAITHSLLVEWKIINRKGMRGRAIVSFGDDRDSRARQSYGRTGLVRATGNSNLQDVCRWLVRSSSGGKPERDSFENAFYRHLSTASNTAHLTFHSTRIRREYPRLSKPNQTSNHSRGLRETR